MRAEFVVGTNLLPIQQNSRGIEEPWCETEVVEEWSGHADGADNPLVGLRLGLLQAKENRR